MKICLVVFLLVVVSSVSGCSNFGYVGDIYGPVHAGVNKSERPYPGGQWFGPIPVEIYEGALLEFQHSPERNLKNSKPTLVEQYFPKSWFPAEKKWRSLKLLVQPGDEIWEFGSSPFSVDGGPIYFGVCIIRNGVVVDAITTREVEN